MAKRYTKKNKSKKRLRKGRPTRKMKYGGDSNPEIVNEQARKNRFRNNLKDLIIQITNKKNIDQAINSIVANFNNNIMINTLIPVSVAGKPLDVKTYSKKNPVVDFVSPVTVIFDNLTGIVRETDLIRLLNAYYINGGNFNLMSSRFKITPFQNELNKRRVDNVKLLLNQSNSFHIIEDGLDDDTRRKLAELIPNEQKIVSEIAPSAVPMPEPMPEPSIHLTIPYPLPQNNDIGYDRNVAPDFWKPIFQGGEELMELRNTFMNIYETDKYTENAVKQFEICDLLEKLFPGYLTKQSLSYNEEPKTLVTVNIVNCIITLLYGILTYKLYEFKQEYIILFKGGRALQLSLNDIPNIKKYFTEDADILIIPNKTINSEYNFDKMQNLSEHIAYLVKWFIPNDINIVVSLPSNPKNTNKEITKVLYNDDTLYKSLSDIAFGDMTEDIKRYFDNPSYSPFYLDNFETNLLFITPTIEDILSEKLYFYTKYSIMKQQLKNGMNITEKGYEDMTQEKCDFYMHKFYKAIKQIVDSLLKRDYFNASGKMINDKMNTIIIMPDLDPNFKTYTRKEKENIYYKIDEMSRSVIKKYMENFDDFSPEEKERIVTELYS
jgi:hypothetical protein